MKIQKVIKVTATTKEMETIGNCIAILEEMEEDIWDELNAGSDYRLESALSTLQELYDRIEVDVND